MTHSRKTYISIVDSNKDRGAWGNPVLRASARHNICSGNVTFSEKVKNDNYVSFVYVLVVDISIVSDPMCTTSGAIIIFIGKKEIFPV